LAGAFLIAEFSIADGVELLCQLDVACFDGVRWLGGWTRFWVARLWILWQKITVLGGMGERIARSAMAHSFDETG
jgi:hypothetical protein